jgi:ABC-type sugar transport system ATPase subunit
MHLLETKNINLCFTGIPVLTNVDFVLKEGEIHCICGENGAGKSCLVKVLTGIYNHYTGSIFIEGKPVNISNPVAARKLGIYAVQQHRDLVPTFNSVENIFLGDEIYKKAKGKQILDFETMRNRSKEIITKFGIEIDIDVPACKLRLSEQGIIAICKALAAESRILLIDEASAPLDNAERKILYEALNRLKCEGKGIVYISHHLEEIFNIGERITVLRNGKNAGVFDINEIDRDGLISAMTGNKKLYMRDAKNMQNEITTDEKPLIEFDKVENAGLSNINFAIYPGEVVGFAGLEGSFKDEIALIAFGLSGYTSGKVMYKGKVLHSKHPIESIRKGIGLVPTDRKNLGLVTCRSICENTVLTAINKQKKMLVRPRWMKEVTTRSIQSLGIKAAGIHQLVEYLSGGNQQKVLLSKWLEAEVEILFLIEPTEGIDVGARTDLYAKLKEISAQGTALVVFTSDIDELMLLSDRIYTMYEGGIVNMYTYETADKNTILSDILCGDISGRCEASCII